MTHGRNYIMPLSLCNLIWNTFKTKHQKQIVELLTDWNATSEFLFQYIASFVALFCQTYSFCWDAMMAKCKGHYKRLVEKTLQILPRNTNCSSLPPLEASVCHNFPFPPAGLADFQNFPLQTTLCLSKLVFLLPDHEANFPPDLISLHDFESESVMKRIRYISACLKLLHAYLRCPSQKMSL